MMSDPEVNTVKRSVELFRALAAGRLDRVEAVQRRSASPNSRNERGDLPLVVAVAASRVEGLLREADEISAIMVASHTIASA
jgi:hypothetical protein